MSDLKIKVCGMTSMHQVEELAVMGVDFAGFIFYEKSSRFLGNKIASEDLKAFQQIKKVGVFVNESADTILNIVKTYGLNAVQLHGDEAPEFCNVLKEKVEVIKAFRVKGDENLPEILAPYEKVVDYFLFDTKAQEYGGTGKKFDWSVLEGSDITLPYFLSGGIGMNDAEAVKSFTAANKTFAIDVNSKFEIRPGEKNIDELRRFVKELSV